jgi:predicted phosphodiesterase
VSRIALISDIHGNLHALRAVLSDIEKHGVEEIICLGDVVGYGPEPGACLELVNERCVAAIRGNHEEAVLSPAQARMFNPQARAALVWTCDRLEKRHVDLIAEMPTWVRRGNGIICVHDAPVPVEDPGYVRTTAEAETVLQTMEATWCFIGHTHIPAVFALGTDKTRWRACRSIPFPGEVIELSTESRYLVNPGSVGQPRDGDWRASWGLLELDPGRFSVQRVAYEVAAVQSAISSAGLPHVLGSRLRIGA